VLREPDHHVIYLRVIDDNLVQTGPLLPHLVEYLAAKEKEYLSIVILALESIPSLKFLGVAFVAWEYDVPLTICGPVDN